jgi:hypothetical protein
MHRLPLHGTEHWSGQRSSILFSPISRLPSPISRSCGWFARVFRQAVSADLLVHYSSPPSHPPLVTLARNISIAFNPRFSAFHLSWGIPRRHVLSPTAVWGDWDGIIPWQMLTASVVPWRPQPTRSRKGSQEHRTFVTAILETHIIGRTLNNKSAGAVERTVSVSIIEFEASDLCGAFAIGEKHRRR